MATKFVSYKQESKTDYGMVRNVLNDGNTQSATKEQINLGSLQRIADAAERQATATELMATKYRQMERDLEYYRKAYQEQTARIAHLLKSNAALRGVINRMKKNR